MAPLVSFLTKFTHIFRPKLISQTNLLNGYMIFFSCTVGIIAERTTNLLDKFFGHCALLP